MSCSSGKKFLTSWETIMHQANSMLASMFKGTFKCATDEDGFAFIDRDGKRTELSSSRRQILTYLAPVCTLPVHPTARASASLFRRKKRKPYPDTRAEVRSTVATHIVRALSRRCLHTTSSCSAFTYLVPNCDAVAHLWYASCRPFVTPIASSRRKIEAKILNYGWHPK